LGEYFTLVGVPPNVWRRLSKRWGYSTQGKKGGEKPLGSLKAPGKIGGDNWIFFTAGDKGQNRGDLPPLKKLTQGEESPLTSQRGGRKRL